MKFQKFIKELETMTLSQVVEYWIISNAARDNFRIPNFNLLREDERLSLNKIRDRVDAECKIRRAHRSQKTDFDRLSHEAQKQIAENLFPF